MLRVGDQAPDFEGISGEGKPIRLRDFIGRKVVLCFYPKNGTMGCTSAACGIRDTWAGFEEAGIQVIGVSGDSVESHQKFSSKNDLPFSLVSDRSREILFTYGAWRRGMKRVSRKTPIAAERMTFLIDESGKIIKIYRRPIPGSHGKKILDFFAEFQKDLAQNTDL
ncbi:MAG: peroxiredoxin [Bacteroidetes bacterium]|nr:peroxiredoxin [Bacteroidota bacterium]MCY4205042.1 peroxiredoxin [Bacteroidota bacterium]